MKPASDHEENELVILHLRQLCETKQKSHVHIGEVSQVAKIHKQQKCTTYFAHPRRLAVMKL